MPQDKRPAILYVDDEAINLKVFDANFRTYFNCITCSSGPEALEIVNSGDQEIAIVMADQRMPGMTGVQVLETVKKVIPDAYRIMMTAYSDVGAMMDAVNRGQVARYIVKPWVKEELLLALEDAMRIYTLQAKLREVEARMVKSAHLVAIGQVSAGIAHELMNPVTYVSQNVLTLRRDTSNLCEYVAPLLPMRPNADVSQALEDMPHVMADLEQGVAHIRSVALGVRAQARGVDVDPTSDLKEVTTFAVKLARVEVRDRARIAMDGPSVQIKAGPVAMCQVLLNLIVNGAHAMDGTGRKGLIQIQWDDGAGEWSRAR